MSRSQQELEGRYVTAGTDGVSISLDVEFCKGCDVCVELCPTAVYDSNESQQGVPTIARPADCTGCMQCERACPDFALRVDTNE